MKAIRLGEYGGYENLEFDEQVDEPKASEGQVLVKVMASSVNPFDTFIIKGYMKDMKPLDLPITPGGDFSGIVVKPGPAVTGFKAGDEVYGTAIVLSGGSGAYAEMATVSVKRIALKPKTVDFVQAASLPLVGVSAIQALIENLKLTKGQKILIHGGAGGIGTVAIQLAKHLGAYVATTVSGDDMEYVKNLGADQVIDYKAEKFEEILKGFDAVYDTIGGQTTEKSFLVLKKGGILTSMKGQPSEELASQYGVTGIVTNTSNNTERLTQLAGLVDGGIIKPQVDKVFPLEKTGEAFVYKEQSPVRGKVVIKINE
jgi:NADPH:quinone reductase-like Zn-dependent oxidoreductase